MNHEEERTGGRRATMDEVEWSGCRRAGSEGEGKER